MEVRKYRKSRNTDNEEVSNRSRYKTFSIPLSPKAPRLFNPRKFDLAFLATMHHDVSSIIGVLHSLLSAVTDRLRLFGYNMVKSNCSARFIPSCPG